MLDSAYKRNKCKIWNNDINMLIIVIWIRRLFPGVEKTVGITGF